MSASRKISQVRCISLWILFHRPWNKCFTPINGSNLCNSSHPTRFKPTMRIVDLIMKRTNICSCLSKP